jgi:Fic family protein
MAKGFPGCFEVWRIVMDSCDGDLQKPCSRLGSNLLQILREEKDVSLSGGIYHELQVRLTYHSSRIEGIMLSEEQTRMMFETQRVFCDGILVDDIIETANHFHAIDYVIDHADEPLTEAVIKDLHALQCVDVGVQVARLDVHGEAVVCQILRHALGQGGDKHALPAFYAEAALAEEVFHLPLDGAHADLGVRGRWGG